MSLYDKLKSELNEQQFMAATHIKWPAVIMAGAGSGKTHTLMSRVSYLIDQGVDPKRILMLTFTNAAADEMKDRATKLLVDRCKQITACTYHKFCNQMLRQYGYKLNIKDYSILSYPETKNMIDYVKSSDAMFDNLKGFPSAGMIADIMSMSINNQLSVEVVLNSSEKYSKYVDYVDEIQTLINNVSVYGFRNQKFTYDDLLVYMNRLLEYDDVCKVIASRFKYIMVDEFQDTNNLQEDIILKISTYNNNIVVVGDISQSIYAFRGANVKNLQSFNDKLDNCKVIPLTYNYRSTQEVLDFANNSMKACVRSWKYYDMSSPDKKGPVPSLIRPMDAYMEADDVFDLIQFYHDKKNIPYSEIAVLARGSMQTFQLENILAKEKITFNKMGGPKFMDLDAVGDMLAFLGVVVNPHDLLSWYRVLQLHPYIGKKFSKAIADGCGNNDFLVENNFKTRKFYTELLSLNRNYTDWRHHGAFMQLFDRITDYYFDVRSRACSESRMSDDNKEEEFLGIEHDKAVVQVLRNMASNYDDVVKFVDDIVLDGVRDDSDSKDNLTISTIHSAKGLEWQVVIVMDCIEKVFPKIRPEEWFTEEDEEELRCFYVAITRAKRYLIMVAPKIVSTYMGNEDAQLSHYINGVAGYKTLVRKGK